MERPGKRACSGIAASVVPGRDTRDEIYRCRWPRSVPAFSQELAAAEALGAALTEQTLNPGPKAARAVELAQTALQAARSAYSRACRQDEAGRRESGDNRDE